MYFTNMRKFISYILVLIFCIIWIGVIWWNVYAECRTEQRCDKPRFGDVKCETVQVCDDDGEKKPNDDKWWECNWIKLNTNFPIIWNCIKTWAWNTDATRAFPTMIWALTKIAMALVLVVCFILIIVAWIMRAWAWEDSQQRTKAKNLLKKVAVTILLLWFSWVILRLINPNFFGWRFI